MFIGISLRTDSIRQQNEEIFNRSLLSLLLHDICRKGTAVIMTTHNYTLVHNYPARIVKCENACLSDVGE